jgi:hypothetical protein
VDTPKPKLSPFEFSGIAVHRRGWRKPVSIRVEPPFSDRPSEFACKVDCSLIDTGIRPIRADEPQHAYSLAFRFLRIVLSDFALFADDGTSFTLPRVPPWDDDWIRPDVLPERGFKMRANAVGPEGELGPFPVAVSAPRPDNDGYAAEVEFGIKDQTAATVHAETLPEAFYAGIDWIAGRLEEDAITLLDLWNEPNELPKRPVPSR